MPTKLSARTKVNSELLPCPNRVSGKKFWFSLRFLVLRNLLEPKKNNPGFKVYLSRRTAGTMKYELVTSKETFVRIFFVFGLQFSISKTVCAKVSPEFLSGFC